jgi:APA family basic amino acid/polyamine antiporter
LIVSALLYIGVAFVAVGVVGSDELEAMTANTAAPLEIIARAFPFRVHWIVALGAMTAMLGVLLNLLLGLSRVLLAMGRRGDMPAKTANATVSVIAVGAIIATLTATRNIKMTWTFSAFTVLVYYAVTNMAAIRLSKGERLYGRGWPWAGLFACLALAFAIDWQVWAAGLSVLAIGMLWHWARAFGTTRVG